MTPARRRRILGAAGWRCRQCDDDVGPFELDHMYQLGLGGDDNDNNFQVLCVPCHKAKSKRDAAARAKTKRVKKKWRAHRQQLRSR